MAYRRKSHRPPRQIEQTALVRESAALKAEVDRLAARNFELLKVVQEQSQTIDLLHDQKIRLGLEIREARGQIAFLQGIELDTDPIRQHIGAGTHFGTLQFLAQWDAVYEPGKHRREETLDKSLGGD